MSRTLFVLAFFASSLSYAQSYEKGFVINSSGDTIKGFVEDFGNRYPEKIRLKNNLSDATTTEYGPDQLQAFSTGGEYYMSATVDVDKKPIRDHQLENTRQPKPLSMLVFLKLIVKGKASLYYLKDPDLKNHYFLQMDGGEIKELEYIRYGTTSSAIGEVEMYKEQLNRSLTGCSTTSDYSAGRYTEAFLKNVVQNYNICSAAGYDQKVALEKAAQFKKEGFVITSTGDTIKGFIENFGRRNPEKIILTKSLSPGPAEEFTAAQLKAVSISSEGYYITATVDVDRKPIGNNNLETGRQPVFSSMLIFLKLVVKGKASLYYLSDPDYKEHYFLQMDNGGLQELQYIRYLTPTGAINQVEMYKEQLNRSLTGCAKSKSYIKGNYTEAYLKKVVLEYNACVGGTTYVEETITAKKSLYLVAGVSFGNGNYSVDAPFIDPSTTVKSISFPSSTSPVLGLGFEIYLGKTTSSLASELNWRSHSFSGKGSSGISAESSMNLFKLNFIYSHYFGQATTKTLLRIGPTVTKVSQSKNQSSNGPIDKDYTFAVGAMGAAGISISRVNIELRYELSRMTSNVTSFNLSEFSVVTGIRLTK